MKVTDGQVRRGALQVAVHLAAPLRRRKSTFEHEPYGAEDVVMHRAHEINTCAGRPARGDRHSEAEEDRHVHRRCSKRLDLSAKGRSSARLPSLEHFAPSLTEADIVQIRQLSSAEMPGGLPGAIRVHGDRTPTATISVLFYVFVP